jgi:Phage Terminase
MKKLTDDLRIALNPALLAVALGITLDQWQDKLLRKIPHRALLNCARQTGKSTISAIISLFVALYLRPGSLILLVSPSLRQSGELFRKCTQLYRIIDHDKPVAESTLRVEFSNGSRIISLPSSEDTVRGYSAPTLVIVDESARVEDSLLAAIRPMLAISNGDLICMSTPFGRRGWWHKEWAFGGPAWERVTYPATECPRILPEFLEEEKRVLGPTLYQSEYCCEFVDAEDAVFSSAVIERAFSKDVEPLWPRGI